MRALTAAIDRLTNHPCRGRPDGTGKRILIAGRYRVIYGVSPDIGRNETAGDVTILRILGPGQMN